MKGQSAQSQVKWPNNKLLSDCVTATIFDGKLWSFDNMIRSQLRYLQNVYLRFFNICDLRSGQFLDLPTFTSISKKSTDRQSSHPVNCGLNNVTDLTLLDTVDLHIHTWITWPPSSNIPQRQSAMQPRRSLPTFSHIFPVASLRRPTIVRTDHKSNQPTSSGAQSEEQRK